MLIREAITYCNQMTGHVFPVEYMVLWLSELDGKLALEFYRADAWTPYDPEDDLGMELLVPFPWDGFYPHYLEAMTYYSNAEYDRYENARKFSESLLSEFRAFMQRTMAALCGEGFPTEKAGGNYVTVIPEQAENVWRWISAYSLAVKHGYKGTEEEWLASLVGPKGETGERGPDGLPYNVLGMYETLEDLIEAHPTGSPGDGYAVGTEEYNEVYGWNEDTQSWVNMGPIKGPKGDTGEKGEAGAGWFYMQVTDDGHLLLTTNIEETPTTMAIDQDTGHLIYTIET